MDKYSFEKLTLDTIDVVEFNGFDNKTVTTTKEWIKFIQEDSHADPLIYRITKNNKLCGYFSALKTKKMGVTIVGSPFSGWSTVHMGLDLNDESERYSILKELLPFIMESEKCWFLQISDRNFTIEGLNSIKNEVGFEVGDVGTYELGISGDDNALYKQMKTDCRNYVRQFERRGATIEQVEPSDEFAEEYYEQLLDVFAKQGLVPTYKSEKVKCLLKHLKQSGNVLCFRVRDPEGKSIATSIFPGYNKKCYFWGGASLRPYQQYRPNEYMIYTAMQSWRDRGCTEFDMVGIRPYKKKFGATEVHYPSVIMPKYRVLLRLRDMAAGLYYFSGKVLWKLHLKR